MLVMLGEWVKRRPAARSSNVIVTRYTLSARAGDAPAHNMHAVKKAKVRKRVNIETPFWTDGRDG
jgi:hypothetical protein